MTYHIISIGDEAYLYKILQFLAMLSSPGTNLYAKLGLMSAIIGLVLVIMTVLTSGGRRFEFGGYIIAIVLFMVFFGSTANVVVEDFYTGRTDIVQGVPLGTAIVGSIVSQAGVAIIQDFQTGTSVPGSSTLSPQYALDALMAYRNLTDSGSYCSSGTREMCQWAKTFQSYVANCALPEYKLQGHWWNGDPNTSPNLLEAIKTPDLGFAIDNYLAPGGPNTPGNVTTCQTAWSDLDQAWDNKQTGIAAGFAGLMKIHTGQGETVAGALNAAWATLSKNTPSPSAGNPSSANLTALLGEAGANAQQSVQNAVSANLLARGLAKGYRDANQAGEAAIIESAANQRNIQFAAQSSLFTRTLRATMTFFEGVIYGMAPFLAFLIPLGPMGFRYVGRYLQVLVWIFLWMPLLSFVNLFEIMAVLREMNALMPAIGNAPLISAVGINQIEYTVSDWIGIGGYLATAAIGFSGFVVFGAVAAFQGIAAEANAPTSLNPGPLAPDMMNVAPPVSIGGAYSQAHGSAQTMAGASNLMFSGSQQLALTKQHALNDVLTQAAALKAEGGFSKQVNLQNAQSWADHYRLTHDAHGGAGMTASAPQGARNTQNTAASQSSTTTVGGHLGGNLNVAGVGVGGVQIGHTNDWRNTTSRDAQQSQGKDFSPNSSFADTRGNDSSLGKDQTTMEQGGTSHNAAIGRTESRLYNAVQTYNEAASASASVGAGMQVSLPQAAAFLGGNAAALSTAERAANGFSPGEFQKNYTQLHGMFPNEEQRTAAASLMTLQSVGERGGQVGMDAQLGLDAALGNSVPEWGALGTSHISAEAGAMLGGGAALRSEVQGHVAGVDGDTAPAAGLAIHPDQIGGVASNARAAFEQRAGDPAYDPEGLRGEFYNEAARGLHGVPEFGTSPLEPLAGNSISPADMGSRLQANVDAAFSPGTGHAALPAGNQALTAGELERSDVLPSAGEFIHMTPAERAAFKGFATQPTQPQE